MSPGTQLADQTKESSPSGMLRWLGGGRHGAEGYVYALHRLTGLVLLLFLISHALLGAARLIGLDLWAQLMSLALSPAVQVLKYPLFAAFAFHALNGVRLIVVELGFAVGRAERPVYPYRGSIKKQRPLLLGTMILAAALLVVGQLDVLRLAH